MNNFLSRLATFVGLSRQLPHSVAALDAWRKVSDARLGEIDRWAKGFDTRLGEIDRWAKGFDTRLGDIDRWAKGFDTRLGDIDRWTEGVDARLGDIRDSLSTLHNQLSLIQKDLSEHHNAISRLALLADLSIPWLGDDPCLANDPEFLLMAYLYSFVPSRFAIDVGADEGRLSELLLQTGYRVFAFEPCPPIVEKLKAKLGANPEITIFDCALGSEESILPLHLATDEKANPVGDESLYSTFKPHFVREGVVFSARVDVRVRTLSSLVANGDLPKDISLVKIDTEGFDLEVIRGLGETRPPIVVTEFWGDEFVFVRHEKNHRPTSSKEIILEMRARRYWWNLIVFRIEGEYAIRFTANLPNAPQRAWGNILFFNQFDLFKIAMAWCQSALPRLQYLDPHE
jgi:FkbM family methyltransferase